MSRVVKKKRKRSGTHAAIIFVHDTTVCIGRKVEFICQHVGWRQSKVIITKSRIMSYFLSSTQTHAASCRLAIYFFL